jgi:perosamine synthetase
VTDPFIPVCAPLLGPRETELVTQAVRDGWISSAGPFVHAFAERFAAYVGVPYAEPVANGTVGLHVVLHALGIGPGDEVIVPSLSFVATAAAVKYCGATPVFAEVLRSTWALDPADVARKLGPRTRAIIPVHLFGVCADVPALRAALGGRTDVTIVEDAAEAFGSAVDGVRVGALADAAVFSFYGNKTITTGEGGMVTTARADLADRVRFLKNHGMRPERRYFHPELGFNYRMTNLQAAVGLGQLEAADHLVGRKRHLDARYRAHLAGADGVSFQSVPANQFVAPWMVTVADATLNEARRDALIDRMRARGIETRPMFHPIHGMPPFAGCPGGPLPITEELAACALALPSGAGLTDAEIDRCATTFLEERART